MNERLEVEGFFGSLIEKPSWCSRQTSDFELANWPRRHNKVDAKRGGVVEKGQPQSVLIYCFHARNALREQNNWNSFYQRKTIVNSWQRCLENNKMVNKSGFLTVNWGKWKKFRLFIHIFNILSFLWKHNTFLAVYCTLLNNSYVLRYILIEKQENKNGKKKKERRKEERSWAGLKPCNFGSLQHLIPNRYTTKLIVSFRWKVIYLMPFPWNIRWQTPFKDDQAT